MLTLSLLVLILAASSLLLWIVYLIWAHMAQMNRTILQIQRILNAYDRPSTLAQNAVEVGQSWIATDQEISSVENRMQSESQQRAGLPMSKRAWAKPTA